MITGRVITGDKSIRTMCRCCGDWPITARHNPNPRCRRHLGRNPCLVESCPRTRDASRGEIADDQAICGVHWRRYVPARSPLRLTYNRFFRVARRDGWSPELIQRFEQFWNGLVRRIRRAEASAVLNRTEIDRLFGWSEAA